MSVNSVNLFSGPDYLAAGFKMINQPGLRRFVVLPLTINILVFTSLLWYAFSRFNGWVEAFVPSLPDWLSFLNYVLWPLFVALVALMVFFTFTTLANLIA